MPTNHTSVNLLAQALQQASFALRVRDFCLAEQIATKILKSNRADSNALLILAHALLGQARAEDAIAPLERAVRRSNDPRMETLLGHSLCGSRRVGEGIELLRRTTARRPPHLPAFQELAGQLAKMGHLDEAVKVCPSADDLRLIRRFEKGGSGSSGLEFKLPAADAASGGLRWFCA